MRLTIDVIHYNDIIGISEWISSVFIFYEFIKFVVSKLSHKNEPSICTQFTKDRYLRCCL